MVSWHLAPHATRVTPLLSVAASAVKTTLMPSTSRVRNVHAQPISPRDDSGAAPTRPVDFLAAMCAAPPPQMPAPAAKRAAAGPTHAVAGPLALPAKYALLAEMFEAVDRVANLRVRRGQLLLFPAVAAAAAGICGHTITPEHVQQMQAVAGDLIQLVSNGLSTSIDAFHGRRDTEAERLSPKALEKQRSAEFRKRLLALTRRAYQRFIDALPAASRPKHTAMTASDWDRRFVLDSVPDIDVDAHRATKAKPNMRQLETESVLERPTKKRQIAGPEALPNALTCSVGDAVEVEYGGRWFPAEVCEVEGGPRPRQIIRATVDSDTG